MKKKGRLPGIRAKFYAAIALGMALAGLSIAAVQSALPLLSGAAREQVAQWEESYAWVYFFAFALLALSFASLFTRSLIRRIEKMGETAEAIGRGDLARRTGDRSVDELGRLARHIDEMAGRLEASGERERQAEAEKNAIIAALSHDMRTPLTSLSGYLEMAELRLNPLLKPLRREWESDSGKGEGAVPIGEALRCIGSARRKTGELKDQAERLLDYALLGADGREADFAVFEPETLLGQVIADFLPELERAGMRAERRSRPEAKGAKVLGDPALLARLLGNLIENAVRYGSSGGLLSVRTACAEGFLTIEIANDGEPIAERDLPRVFDRLYTGEKSRGADAGGRGLGLAIVREIARLHGGRAEVRSGTEETCFKIVLPLAPDPSES
ncbi:sensor histidine kinase [Saccharibacillus alkalitolerans]|uniref:histidine kinase n=1 Tax=Saccharibacillus alkalitolerans TaxID=2705290 RepID=A0ABX0F5U8_9BACL|nr:HAMP domain-containing sensor histidine kinase [Saccharibacillus alkalitolerans]NGZ76321.1 HAMP domain-containing histidine kinase [Saccharibacillus alkalitolerans]